MEENEDHSPVVTVAVADSNDIYRQGAVASFERGPRFEVVADLGRLSGVARKRLKSLKPDLLVWDPAGEGRGNGLDWLDSRAGWPGANLVVLTEWACLDRLFQIAAKGISVLMKSRTNSAQLLSIGCLVARSSTVVIDDALCDSTAAHGVNILPLEESNQSLTFRQQQVLVYILDGYSDREIARRLGVEPSTVESHVRAIMAKLAASNRAQVGLHAVKFGLLELLNDHDLRTTVSVYDS